jgi:phage terminase large subunit-like protein
MPDFASRAEAYARRVVAGEQAACKWVRLAAERHLLDLASQAKADFPYRFDSDAANGWAEFVELMPHVKGRWAQQHELLKLEDWQAFLICVPFGWVRKADGLRRYRRTYIEVPRKNAKSTLTAAIGLKAFCADGEHGAEVYSGAGSEKQAWEVFGPARLMAQKTPGLKGLGVQVNAKTLSILEKASKFEPIIGKPGDGSSPSFSITDEYHEHATSEQYDTMVTGMGARDQPMAWVITTAGDSIEGPCYALRQEVQDVLEGKVENPELFGLIYTVDEGDEWDSIEALRKANPNIGVSVREDYLLSQLRDAVNNPRKQATFKTKHLNVWVQSASPFFDSDRWRSLGSDGLKMEDFKGEPCWIGVDLAAKLDLCSVAVVFARDDHYYVFGKHYLPESALEPAENAHYRQWHAEGRLVVTDKYQHTDYDQIEDDIREIGSRHPIAQLGFDPWGATQTATHLMRDGITCIEVPQRTQHLSEPMKWVQAMIADGRIHHTGDPVLSWALGNVTAQEDRNGNVFPRKERAERKIDPAVALIMAMGRALSGSGPERSVYEEEGIFFL